MVHHLKLWVRSAEPESNHFVTKENTKKNDNPTFNSVASSKKDCSTLVLSFADVSMTRTISGTSSAIARASLWSTSLRDSKSHLFPEVKKYLKKTTNQAI